MTTKHSITQGLCRKINCDDISVARVIIIHFFTMDWVWELINILWHRLRTGGARDVCIIVNFLPTEITEISDADYEGSVTLWVGTAREWLKVEIRISSIFTLGKRDLHFEMGSYAIKCRYLSGLLTQNMNFNRRSTNYGSLFDRRRFCESLYLANQFVWCALTNHIC